MKVDFERLEDPSWYHGESKLDCLSSALNLCGCGSEEPVKLLYDCLVWASLNNEERKSEEWGKGFYRSVAHELAAKLLDSYGLLEHGTGIGWAWITEDGKRLLKIIDNYKEGQMK